jgi:hypothetical protein
MNDDGRIVFDVKLKVVKILQGKTQSIYLLLQLSLCLIMLFFGF